MATVLFAAIVFDKEVLGPWLLLGMLPGVLIDVLFLKRWVKNAYQINAKIIGGLYIFYSVCALGFFMGIPIGCIFLGVLAGFYAGRKVSLAGNNQINSRGYFRRVAVFSSAVMVLICALITLWAIAGNMIGYEVEFPVSFTLTAPIFWAVVFAGGAFLVLLQYWLTNKAAKVTFNLSN
ncbi:MAG: hypothetical protein ACYSR5_08975 [Planctomycetota bacterium]